MRQILADCIARKKPITTEILLQLFRLFSFDNHLHVCMPALFLVAFFLVSRISNLVPYELSDLSDLQPCVLMLSSVLFTAQGGLLRITCIKTLQLRERVLEIPLPLILGSPLCPVAAIRQYLYSVKLPRHSPLYVCRSQGTYKRILAHQYNEFIKTSLANIGLNPGNFSSHSFCRGGASFAFCNRAPTASIQWHGDWKVE